MSGVGSSGVSELEPVRVTVFEEAPFDEIVILAECVPIAVGLYVTVIVADAALWLIDVDEMLNWLALVP